MVSEANAQQQKGAMPVEVRVGKRAQVVIPASVRTRLGIQEGDVLHLEVDAEGRVLLTRVPEDPVERLLRAGSGLLERDEDVVQVQRGLRAELDR
ncbi:MAG: AbrB/MazE/SpoVT family DNA-binding domain-containing protein [Nitriliruptorales bacterium]|nr:AbrB/MazE/SpoVT family DNA-binding domain-containing protein [Nitriliruptorales bacterium]